MPSTPSLASRHPQERKLAAQEELRIATGFLDEAIRQSEGCPPDLDPEERQRLREIRQGAEARVQNWERWIKRGCPRSR